MPFTTGAVPDNQTPVTLLIPNHLYQEWAAAALQSGHTIDTYLIATVTIATRLKLLEGTQRLPRKGAGIDPLLAEAIRVNSRNTPWEHKADLLLATPGLTPTTALPQQPDPATPTSPRTHTAQQLMARHGLPVRQPPQRIQYATIGGTDYTWNQTALILAIWEHAQENWTGRRVADHGTAAGFPARTVEAVMRQMVKEGHIQRRPHPQLVMKGRASTARHQHRLAPPVARALLAGNYGPAASRS